MVGKTGMSARERERRKPVKSGSAAGIAAEAAALTQFDGEPRRKLHLHELPEFVEVLERGDDLQHVEQPEGAEQREDVKLQHEILRR